MSTLKRTRLYEAHTSAQAQMVDFGGWEMPMQYPTGILAEHLYTRRHCSLFDVSHMGRFVITGSQALPFLQHVLTSNAAALVCGRAQYTILANEHGGAIDDAYLYRFNEKEYFLVVNAANAEKDFKHLTAEIAAYDATLTDESGRCGSIAIQGPESVAILQKMSGGAEITEPKRNSLGVVTLDGMTVWAAKTGYTGEPMGFELFAKNADLRPLWDRLIELGAKPAGLGARDTLRMEAGLPLYGHEMGEDHDGNEIPVFAVSQSKFAVNFSEEKGDYIGRAALEKEFAVFNRIMGGDFSDRAGLPKRTLPITLLGRGIMRAGCPILKNGRVIGAVTSGTMIPYYVTEGEGEAMTFTEETGRRSIGFGYVESDTQTGDLVEIDIRGKIVPAVIPARHMKNNVPPYATILLYNEEETK